jgi:hypothetical protein
MAAPATDIMIVPLRSVVDNTPRSDAYVRQFGTDTERVERFGGSKPRRREPRQGVGYDWRGDCPKCGARNRAYRYGSILLTPCCRPGYVQRFKRSRKEPEISSEMRGRLISWLDDGALVGRYMSTRTPNGDGWCAMSDNDRRNNLHMRKDTGKQAIKARIDALRAEGWVIEVEDPGPNEHHACFRYRVVRATKQLMKRATQILQRARKQTLRAVLALADALRGVTHSTDKAGPVQANARTSLSRPKVRHEVSFKAGHTSFQSGLGQPSRVIGRIKRRVGELRDGFVFLGWLPTGESGRLEEHWQRTPMKLRVEVT